MANKYEEDDCARLIISLDRDVNREFFDHRVVSNFQYTKLDKLLFDLKQFSAITGTSSGNTTSTQAPHITAQEKRNKRPRRMLETDQRPAIDSKRKNNSDGSEDTQGEGCAMCKLLNKSERVIQSHKLENCKIKSRIDNMEKVKRIGKKQDNGKDQQQTQQAN